MQPRLKSSKKWTAFPREYAEQIQKVFQENFAKQLEGDEKLIVEGRIYSGEIMLRVGLHKKGDLRQANFEISTDYKEDAMERINDCVDAAASMMMDYFENEGEVDFPRVWKAFPFKKRTLYLQFTTENSELEAAADKLLGDEDGLVHEAADEEEASASDDPEAEGEDGPRMFGKKTGKKKLH